eukprot:UN05818
MSSCRKRKIDENLDEMQTLPPSKKHRANPNISTKKQNKTVFDDVHDQKQYLKIYNVLTQTKLILNTNTPLAISQLISEYSTGKLSKCFYCDEIVWYLNGDTFENDIFKIKQGLVCKQCKEKRIDCKFCGIIFPLFETNLCCYCHTPICSNIVNCENNNECKCSSTFTYTKYRISQSCVIECDYCHSKLCGGCSVKCEDCGPSRCDDVSCVVKCES